MVLQGEDVSAGAGSSKKAAEMAAALQAWTKLSGRDGSPRAGADADSAARTA